MANNPTHTINVPSSNRNIEVLLHRSAEWEEDTRSSLTDLFKGYAAGSAEQNRKTRAAARQAIQERRTALNLTEYVTRINYSNNIMQPYSTAMVSLALYGEDAQLLADGDLISDFSSLSKSGGGGPRRIFRTGGFLTITEKVGTKVRPLFFGVITMVNAETSVAPNGVKSRGVTINCESFMHLLTTSQLRLTPVGEKNQSKQTSALLQRLTKSAIAQTGDYNQGFLAAVKLAITKDLSNAQFLEQVIKTLAQYKLPLSAGGGFLGESITVIDGSPESFNSVGLTAETYTAGNVSDVVRGTLYAKFSAYAMNNMTHLEIIEALFNPLPQIIELFPVVLPAREIPITPLEKAMGINLVIIYRYKPCTPIFGCTKLGYTKMLTLLGDKDTKKIPKGATAAEQYFIGVDKAPQGRSPLNENKAVAINSDNIYGFTQAWGDDDHINAVFCEQAFGAKDAHNFTLLRPGIPLYCDVDDINLRGLRCYSTQNPIIPVAGSKFAQKEFLLSSAAIAERMFHSTGMEGYFFSGSFRLYEEDARLKAGMWVSLSDGQQISNTSSFERGSSIICYITSVSVDRFVDAQGISYAIQSVMYTRGSYGYFIPVPHADVDVTQAKIEGYDAAYAEETDFGI